MRPFLKGRVVLVTAGPTREYLDPVRYISNESSGIMGFELAAAARAAGAKVLLVCGPVNLPTPVGVKRINIVSADEMRRAVKSAQPKADIVIMAAAVADWKTSDIQQEKIKKREGQRSLVLKLVKTPDILAEIGRTKKKDQIVIGFALETNDLLKNASKKLVKKNCDYIVANLSSSIGSATTACYILSRNGKIKKIPRDGKKIVAKKILSIITRACLRNAIFCHCACPPLAGGALATKAISFKSLILGDRPGLPTVSRAGHARLWLRSKVTKRIPKKATNHCAVLKTYF